MKKASMRVEILHVVGRPDGYRFIYEFCKTIEDGKTPEPEALKLVADALWLILTEKDHDRIYGLDLFADKLNLKWGLGEKPADDSLEKHLVKCSAVLEYQELVNTGVGKITASELIAPKYGKTGKTIRRWARVYESDVEDYKSAIEAKSKFRAQLKARQKNKMR